MSWAEMGELVGLMLLWVVVSELVGLGGVLGVV